ncbi:MAG TPA: FtsX-like permease family protein [Alphaproteobacteria bacterium]|nr:FtsX-like permease family protein [Alphaproteobacteria bacterium]
MKRRLEIIRLAWADLRHDRLVSLCQVILVMAVVAPLLLLFALKNGVATSLIGELERDPETLRLRPVGSYRLGPDFFADLTARPESGFLVPATRPIAAQIYLRRQGEERTARLIDAQMIPTTEGDPLEEGAGALAGPDGVIAISAKAARELAAEADDRLIGRIERNRGGRPEAAEFPLQVRRVLPERLDGAATVYVDLTLLVQAERYRDGYAVPAFSAEGDRPWSEIGEFASFRLYARELGQVAPLAAHLRTLGIEVKTEAAQIEAVMALDRNLDAVLGMIGAVAGLGLLGSLLAGMVAGVERKRRALAALALLGCERERLSFFPVAQAAILAAAGAAASLALYVVAAWLVNRYFGPIGGAGMGAARLSPGQLLGALLLAISAPLLPAFVAGRRVTQIEPAEALREL